MAKHDSEKPYPRIVEDRIKASKVLTKLVKFVEATPDSDPDTGQVTFEDSDGNNVYMTASQVTVGLALLKKVAPDKREVAHTGEDGAPLSIMLYTDGDGLRGRDEGSRD